MEKEEVKQKIIELVEKYQKLTAKDIKALMKLRLNKVSLSRCSGL
jgi:uncharacterized protein (DUF433 family)